MHRTTRNSVHFKFDTFSALLFVLHLCVTANAGDAAEASNPAEPAAHELVDVDKTKKLMESMNAKKKDLLITALQTRRNKTAQESKYLKQIEVGSIALGLFFAFFLFFLSFFSFLYKERKKGQREEASCRGCGFRV